MRQGDGDCDLIVDTIVLIMGSFLQSPLAGHDARLVRRRGPAFPAPAPLE